MPSGSPPGSGSVAPSKIASSLPASGFGVVPSAFTFGWNGTNESVMPKREQLGSADVLVHESGSASGRRSRPPAPPAPSSSGCPARTPWRLPAGHLYGRVVARPDAGDGARCCVAAGHEARGAVRVASWSRRCPRGRRAAGEDLLDLPRAQRVRARQLLGEHRRVGRRLDALPDVAPGLLVVAVADVERRREADVDVGLRHADDPRDPLAASSPPGPRTSGSAARSCCRRSRSGRG